MKSTMIRMKLTLNKETVADLNQDDLKDVKGGVPVITTTNPYSVTWLECCGPRFVTYPTMTFCGLACP